MNEMNEFDEVEGEKLPDYFVKFGKFVNSFISLLRTTFSEQQSTVQTGCEAR